MKKLLIFDMDNVICNLQDMWLSLYNKKYNDNVKKKDILSYDIHKYCRYGHAIYEFVNNSEIFRMLQPIPGAVESLKYLIKKGHKVRICSAAQENQIEGKLDWLQKYLPEIPQEDIIFSFDKSVVEGDFMFDDAPHNLYNSSCLVSVLFDQPWNQKIKDFIIILTRRLPPL